jgi:hypothetical protein
MKPEKLLREMEELLYQETPEFRRRVSSIVGACIRLTYLFGPLPVRRPAHFEGNGYNEIPREKNIWVYRRVGCE